jgi:hypothetical protein
MSPITGVSWADLGGAGIAFVFTVMLVGLQLLIADSIPLSGRGRDAARWLTVGLVVPFLVVLLNTNWLASSDQVRVATLVGWLGGTPLLIVVADRIRRRARPDQPPPLPPDRYDPAARPPEAGGRPRLPRLAAVALVAAAIVTPQAAVAISTRNPCEEVEVLLAERRLESVEAEPAGWMPHSEPLESIGYAFADGGPMTLDDVVQTRRNPDESREELEHDGFVSGFDQRWVGPSDHVEFAAQRFATTEGALAFHAFANRYACQFVNVAFRGPHGSIGLQIRFASGRPIGEQLTWVSNTTRILVFVDFDAPPPDHARVESLAELVSP